MKPQHIHQLSAYRTIVIFGPSGGGKTTLAATSPKPYFVDSNDGLLVLDQRPEFEHVRGNKFRGMKTLDRVLEHFRGQRKPDWSKLFQSCVWDHMDDIQSNILEELGLKGAERDGRRDPDLLEQRDWGKMANQLRRYIRAFKQVSVHKILICGEREDYEGRMRPALQGQLKEQLPYFCDEILYLDVLKNGSRRLYLDPTERFIAKSRAHWMQPGGLVRATKKGQRFVEIQFSAADTLTKLFQRIVATRKRHTIREK